MAFFDFLKREAKDLGDAAEKAKDRFDQELTKREQELKMTPSEKVAALQEQAGANDAKFDAILEKAGAQDAMADAVAEVGSLPKVTHIVLPDGQVRTGEQGAVVDQDGTVHEVPLVAAPTAEDLAKPPAAEPAPPASTVSEPVVAAPIQEAPPLAPADDPLPPPPVVASSATPSTEPASAQVTEPVAPAAAAAESAAPAESSDPEFDKTPAQLKYERARAAANDLLDELREELKDDGDI